MKRNLTDYLPFILNYCLGSSLVFLFLFLGLSQCSLESPPTREIRGHTENFDGVVHGKGAFKALRYCTKCHGDQLQGGSNGEFSCLKCHGEKWLKVSPNVGYFPESHTELRGGKWFHHPDSQNNVATCATSSCHESDLSGSTQAGTPSCFLCHDNQWDDD